MNINMSETQFNKLIQLCTNSQKELSGSLEIQIINDKIHVMGIKLDDNNLIESSNSKEITYDSKKYISKMIHTFSSHSSPVYISFHTHPKGAPILSNADREHLKYVQNLSEKVSTFNNNTPIAVIEGIITSSEIAFYLYDLKHEKVKRLPLYVDEIEKILSTEKSKSQIFKDGFLKGIRKAKRESVNKFV